MNGTAMRIALFTHSVNPRGGVVHTLELGRALHEAGQDVTIFAPSVGGAPMFRASPCRVVLAPVAAHGNDTVSMVRTRIDALKTALIEDGASGFDVLHAQDSISGNALAELREAGAIRGFVRTVHHLDTFDDPRLCERHHDRQLRRARPDVAHGVRRVLLFAGVEGVPSRRVGVSRPAGGRVRGRLSHQ